MGYFIVFKISSLLTLPIHSISAFHTRATEHPHPHTASNRSIPHLHIRVTASNVLYLIEGFLKRGNFCFYFNFTSQSDNNTHLYFINLCSYIIKHLLGFWSHGRKQSHFILNRFMSLLFKNDCNITPLALPIHLCNSCSSTLYFLSSPSFRVYKVSNSGFNGADKLLLLLLLLCFPLKRQE